MSRISITNLISTSSDPARCPAFEQPKPVGPVNAAILGRRRGGVHAAHDVLTSRSQDGYGCVRAAGEEAHILEGLADAEHVIVAASGRVVHGVVARRDLPGIARAVIVTSKDARGKGRCSEDDVH
jgi:hypothetical protein